MFHAVTFSRVHDPVRGVLLSMPCAASLLIVLTLLSDSAPAQTPRDIVSRSLKIDNDATPLAAQYTYREREDTKEFDSAGRVTKTTSEVHEILFLGGKRYEHLVEKDGKPLAVGEARKEQARIDKASAEASRLTPEERKRRFDAYVHERAKQRSAVQGIPDAYTFTLLDQPLFNGRRCWLLQAQPKPEYRGKYSNILRRMSGRIWIDQTDYEWVKAEADVLEDVSFGLFLAKLSKGAHFTLERARVNNEIWLPKVVTAKLAARALIKNIRVEQSDTYSDYRKFSTESRMLDTVESDK